MSLPTKAKVVIIGGGIHGLSTAWKLSETYKNPNDIVVLEKKDTIKTWFILNNSLINIVSNSTFSYTAALLNTNNLNNKLRCILPKWVNYKESSFEKGWLSPPGFIEL